MSELICLELSVIWWVVHVLCQAVTARGEFGDAFLFSPRDANVTAKGLVCGRATRALRNYVENLVPFVALDLALIVTQHAGGTRRHALDHWPRHLSADLPRGHSLHSDRGLAPLHCWPVDDARPTDGVLIVQTNFPA